MDTIRIVFDLFLLVAIATGKASMLNVIDFILIIP